MLGSSVFSDSTAFSFDVRMRPTKVRTNTTATITSTPVRIFSFVEVSVSARIKFDALNPICVKTPVSDVPIIRVNMQQKSAAMNAYAP